MINITEQYPLRNIQDYLITNTLRTFTLNASGYFIFRFNSQYYLFAGNSFFGSQAQYCGLPLLIGAKFELRK